MDLRHSIRASRLYGAGYINTWAKCPQKERGVTFVQLFGLWKDSCPSGRGKNSGAVNSNWSIAGAYIPAPWRKINSLYQNSKANYYFQGAFTPGPIRPKDVHRHCQAQSTRFTARRVSPKSLGRGIPDISRFGIYHSTSARVPCCYGKRPDHRGQARADPLDQT